MREIKFRAWNKDWKLMVQPEDIEAIMFDDVTSQACDVKFNITTTDGQQNSNVWEDSPDIVLMQFTGLKDKNDKEIWEGDVLMNNDQPWEVYYADGAWRLVLRGGDKASNDHLLLLEDKHSEVVGNIYES